VEQPGTGDDEQAPYGHDALDDPSMRKRGKKNQARPAIAARTHGIDQTSPCRDAKAPMVGGRYRRQIGA
jgi:hypothetical protein